MPLSARKQAHNHLVKALTYKFVAYGCAVVGIVLCLYFYINLADYNVMSFLQRPLLLVITLLPLLPALVLFKISGKHKNSVKKILAAEAK